MNRYGRILTGTAVKIGALILFYSLLRFIFYRYNLSHFPEAKLLHFVGGLRFDLSAIAYLNLPWIAIALLPFPFFQRKGWQLGSDIYYIAANSTALLANCIDIGYFPYVSKRLTADIFSYLRHAQFDTGALLPVFLRQFLWMLPLLALFIALMVWLCRKSRRYAGKANPETRRGLSKILLHSGSYVAVLFLALTLMRGGWQLRPLSLVSAGDYATPQYMPLVLNSPFTLLRTIGKESIPEFGYFPTLADAERIYNPLHIAYAAPDIAHPPVKNVVLIVLEGISQELFAFYHPQQPGYPKYCPFLDSLASRSWAFNGIANGRRTMEGIPAIVCGIPTLMEHAYIETPFVQNRLRSPVEMLRRKGFHTCFFHGAENGSMNFESFCHAIGYEAYFGLNEYPHPEDYDGSWGIPDRSFLHFMAERLHTMPQPFFATVMTLSSHHPFRVPKDAGGRTFPQGTHPMHTVSAYTDFALQEFFLQLSRESWYDSTLFIITADHAYEGSDAFTQNPYGNYLIPLLFYHPAADTAFFRTDFMQQTDLMPSLFAYLSLQDTLLCFGQNVFERGHVPTAVNYLSGVYQLFHRRNLLQYDGKKVVGFYPLEGNERLTNDRKNENSPEQREALLCLQAILQSYSHRMRNNALTAPSTQTANP